MTDYVYKVTNLKDVRAKSQLRDKQALQLMTEELLKRRKRKLSLAESVLDMDQSAVDMGES